MNKRKKSTFLDLEGIGLVEFHRGKKSRSIRVAIFTGNKVRCNFPWQLPMGDAIQFVQKKCAGDSKQAAGTAKTITADTASVIGSPVETGIRIPPATKVTHAGRRKWIYLRFRTIPIPKKSLGKLFRNQHHFPEPQTDSITGLSSGLCFAAWIDSYKI